MTRHLGNPHPHARLLPRLIGALLVSCAAAAGQSETRLALSGANVGDEFGSVINAAGDLNADGFDDVIVGAPFDLPAIGSPGSATVFSGATGAVLIALAGTAPNQALGFGVASARDVNNDGTPDVIVGLSGNGSTGGAGGGAKVFSGVGGALLHTFAGTVVNDGFGQFVDGLGDLNGDGFGDVIVGTAFAPGGSNPGYARVFSGANGAILYAKTGTFVGQRYGLAYAAGDVNADGVNDFMIGAIGDNVNGANSGSAFVYSGATGALLHAFHGVSAGNQLGYAGGAAGDVNGDGYGDVIVGTYIPAGNGYARVYSGADGAVLFHLTDGVFGDAFGHTVAGVGDVNGDGTPDFAVSAPNSNVNGALSGFVRVYSGATGAQLRDFIGAQTGIHFGYSVNRAGDVNDDGLDDVAIGTLIPSALGMPGQASVVSICAAQPYGIGLLPTQTLSMSWIKGAPGSASQGGISVSGAAPLNSGVLAANVTSAQVTLFSVPVLIDPGSGLLAIDIPYDAAGHVELPVDLRNPSLAGVGVHVQGFEYNAGAPEGVYASNGLMLLFGN